MPRNRRGPSPTGPPTLLVLQLDSERLRRDGLDLTGMTQSVSRLAATLGEISVEVLEGTTERGLLDGLADLARNSCSFDVVVAIGHSNQDGIRIASDRFCEWESFANYLKPFEPRRLMLVACDSGRWPAANVLFSKLRRLRRIYASPVNASRELAVLMLLMLPYLFHVKVPRQRTITAIQAGIAALTGGQLREWVRGRDHHNPSGLLLDLAAQAADPIVRQLPGMLGRLLA